MYKQLHNISLKNFNTFGIKAKAQSLYQISSPGELCEAIGIIRSEGAPMLVLGGGSNILFTRDFNGTIVQPLIQSIVTTHEDDDSVTLRVGAGVEWDSLVEYTVERGWGGLENLSLIPGSVGASPIQNIGAYGTEAKDTITRVMFMDIDSCTLKEIEGTQCHFGYRTSIFKTELKGKAIITHVDFILRKKPKLLTHYGSIDEELKKLGDSSIMNVRQAIINIRRSKLPDPKELGNAGSFFKNPIVSIGKLRSIQGVYPQAPSYPIDDKTIKIPAGWLIEQCGWKGKRKGNVGVHAQQALVLVNYGSATGKEVLELAYEIKESVKKNFGVELAMEVNVI